MRVASPIKSEWASQALKIVSQIDSLQRAAAASRRRLTAAPGAAAATATSSFRCRSCLDRVSSCSGRSCSHCLPESPANSERWAARLLVRRLGGGTPKCCRTAAARCAGLVPGTGSSPPCIGRPPPSSPALALWLSCRWPPRRPSSGLRPPLGLLFWLGLRPPAASSLLAASMGKLVWRPGPSPAPVSSGGRHLTTRPPELRLKPLQFRAKLRRSSPVAAPPPTPPPALEQRANDSADLAGTCAQSAHLKSKFEGTECCVPALH